MKDLAKLYENLLQLKGDLETKKSENTRLAHLNNELELRLDDAENQYRHDNTILGPCGPFCHRNVGGIRKNAIRHCWDNLEMTIDAKEIVRERQLDRNDPSRLCPLIVNVTKAKTKGEILSQGPKFKATTYTVGESFSCRVQYSRTQLVAFAKAKFALNTCCSRKTTNTLYDKGNHQAINEELAASFRTLTNGLQIATG